MKKIYLGLAALVLSLAMFMGCSSPTGEPGGTFNLDLTEENLLFEYENEDTSVNLKLYSLDYKYVAVVTVKDLQTSKEIELISGLLGVNDKVYEGDVLMAIHSDNFEDPVNNPKGHIKFTRSIYEVDLELSELTSKFEIANGEYDDVLVKQN